MTATRTPTPTATPISVYNCPVDTTNNVLSSSGLSLNEYFVEMGTTSGDACITIDVLAGNNDTCNCVVILYGSQIISTIYIPVNTTTGTTLSTNLTYNYNATSGSQLTVRHLAPGPNCPCDITPTPTPTVTSTSTRTPTQTPTQTPTNTPTNTLTPSNTLTPTRTPTPTQTNIYTGPICAAGAGSPEVNNTFVYDGLVNGRPSYYFAATDVEIIWTGTVWFIRDRSTTPTTEGVYYRSLNNVYTPYQVTTWQTISGAPNLGVAPVPVVSIGECPTPTPTPTATSTATLTQTPTNTLTPSNTLTPTQTPTRTQTPTNTLTPSNTLTPTQTPTRTQTPTSTQTPTRTLTPTPTSTSTLAGGSPTPTPTVTQTQQLAEVLFTSTGATAWQVPDGVVELYVVCVGGGGGGAGSDGDRNEGNGGGGGGALSYGTFAVTALESLTVTVGVGGNAGATGGNGGAGGASTVARGATVLISGGGGGGGVERSTTSAAGGTSGGTERDGGGNGGAGGGATGNDTGGGGGGAGGYSGNGGAGGGTGAGSNGSGGGGGGGGATNSALGYGGGGVGLYGEGTSGTGGALNAVGTGGSGGNNGTRGNGGTYGGGGGARDDDSAGSGGAGAQGACRIVYSTIPAPTPTTTATISLTPTNTATPTNTPTNTPTRTPTATPTVTTGLAPTPNPVPTFQQAGAGTARSTTGNLTPAYPTTGLTAGDLFVLQVTTRNATTTVNTPTGWTASFGPDNGGSTTTVRQRIFHRIASGTESGNETVTFGSDAGVTKMARIYRYRGTRTNANPFEAGNTSVGTSTTISQPSVTTTGVNRLVVAYVFVSDDNALDAFVSATGGTWSESVAEFTTTLGNDGAIQAQEAIRLTAGTISGGTEVMAASDPWGVRAAALIPIGG